jgi:hypothetical protein
MGMAVVSIISCFSSLRMMLILGLRLQVGMILRLRLGLRLQRGIMLRLRLRLRLQFGMMLGLKLNPATNRVICKFFEFENVDKNLDVCVYVHECMFTQQIMKLYGSDMHVCCVYCGE